MFEGEGEPVELLSVSFESRDCSAYLLIITRFNSNKKSNDSLDSALLRGFVFLDDVCQYMFHR